MPMPKIPAYLTRAVARYTIGTRHATPNDTVRHGTKSIEEWCDILEEERALHNARRLRALRPRASRAKQNEL